jgi:electron transport complex protein RnfB
MTQPLAQRIDDLLPQTQCTQCGYDGCRPYAHAIAEGTADINQCPPGGDAGVAKLALLLGRAPKPLNPVNGAYRAPQVAVIDEAICIGCTKCIQACPVDAIVGASKLMHTVIASWCTGCELCIPPCPVDCISLAAVAALPAADLSRNRHDARDARLVRDEAERTAKLEAYE